LSAFGYRFSIATFKRTIYLQVTRLEVPETFPLIFLLQPYEMKKNMVFWERSSWVS
jgi:hypothetical protein